MHHVDHGARKNQISRGHLSIDKFQAGPRKTSPTNCAILESVFVKTTLAFVSIKMGGGAVGPLVPSLWVKPRQAASRGSAKGV